MYRFADEDECALKHDCQHICTNTFESYECRCRLGYRLEKDGRSCILGKILSLRFDFIIVDSMKFKPAK